MKAILAILAITLTSAPADGDEPAPAADELLEPPAPLAWPSGLPAQLTLPGPGIFIAYDDADEEIPVPAGIVLPDKLANHVHERLRYLDGLPALCRAKLEGLDHVRRTEAEVAVHTSEAICGVRIEEARADVSGFTVLEGLGLAAGGIVVGVVVGVVVGFAVR